MDESGEGPRQTTVWKCKIGWAREGERVSDALMRDAAVGGFRILTGREADFIFSGWGAELKERELAVVEDREPDFFTTRFLEGCLHELRVMLRAGQPLPEWEISHWLNVLAIKLGQAANTGMVIQGFGGGEPESDGAMVLGGQLLALAAGALDMLEALDLVATLDLERAEEFLRAGE